MKRAKVQVSPVSIGDRVVDYGKDKNEYLYEIYNNIPIPFIEDELTKSLHGREKIMHIEIVASIKKTNGQVGIIIARE